MKELHFGRRAACRFFAQTYFRSCLANGEPIRIVLEIDAGEASCAHDAQEMREFQRISALFQQNQPK